MAGPVFPWPDHVRYFETHIRPRLSRTCRWIGPIQGERKRRLLSIARCVLIPSLVEETSSLVAMEALAAGTPVIAFAAGALREIVEEGLTGFLVRNVAEMAAAISRVECVDSETCRRAARERFDLSRSTRAYLDLYSRMATGGLPARLGPAAFPRERSGTC